MPCADCAILSKARPTTLIHVQVKDLAYLGEAPNSSYVSL